MLLLLITQTKFLIVLSALSGGVYIISSVSVVEASAGDSRSKFYSNCFSNNRNNQNITEHNKKQKEKA